MSGAIKDNDGNTIYREGNVIWLKLTSEKRRRKLGVLLEGQTILKTWRTKAKHYLDKMDAYGFNYALLDRLTHLKKVYLKIGKKSYLIPAKDILARKNVKYFKQSGFEVQCFMTVPEIETYLTKEKK